jgi:hypothetical protein
MKSNLIITFPLLLLIMGSCGGTKMVSHRQKTPLVIDGDNKDWGDSVLSDYKSKFTYKISNDDQNLYVMLQMDDEALVQKVMRNGLTVWFDSTNRKDEVLGINYPRSHKEEDGAQMQSMDRRQRPSGDRGVMPKNKTDNVDFMKDALVQQLQEIEFVGFNGRESNVMMIGEAIIRPVLKFDENRRLLYECAIPLAYIAKKHHQSPNLISIGFKTGEMQSSSRSSMGGGPGMEGGPNGGPSGGPEMGGGPEGMGGPQSSESASPSVLWIKNYCISCN